MPPPEGTPNKLASFIRNTSARVKTFANEEVGSRVVAPFARSETPTSRRGRHDSSAAAGSPSAHAMNDADGSVPGDGTHLGATRDHTHLFTRLRDTAIYIRETEAAARAADALDGGARRRLLTPSKRWRTSQDPSRAAASSADAPPSPIRRRPHRPVPRPPLSSRSATPPTPSPATGAPWRRISSRSTSPSWIPCARRRARRPRPTRGPTLVSDVETHLATLLLVEAELQAALKRLKVSHVRAGTITVTPGDPEESLMKRNVVNAHAIARTSLTARFKRARDGVGEMLKGNAAAKVVSQQRLLRASDAAYGDLERFYASLVRLRAELAAHPKTTGAAGARVRLLLRLPSAAPPRAEHARRARSDGGETRRGRRRGRRRGCRHGCRHGCRRGCR